MENPISVSLLNDFIFCPASIYFHMVDANMDKLSYASTEQHEGSALHERIDKAEYSTRKDILQGISVYSEKYNLSGRIDLFDIRTGILTERKRKIEKLYDGYYFQMYSYCFALREMGYVVNGLRFHSMLDNKTYSIPLPENDQEMFSRFECTIRKFISFTLDGFHQENHVKCNKCVYEPLCSFSIDEEQL